MMHFVAQVLLAALAGAGVASFAVERGRRRKLARLVGVLSLDTPSLVPSPVTLMEDGRFVPRAIVRNLRQLGIPIRSRDCWLALGGAVLVLSTIGLLAGALAAACIGATLILACCALVNVLAMRHVGRLAGQIPGFLDRLRQMLIVGNSLPTAFARAVQGSQPALARFFDPTLRRIHNGASFSDSIQQSADDIGLYEMQLFAGAVAANTRFGGSLAQALNNLVTDLRKRAAIERELRSSTAQIRASAWVLGLLPMVVAASIVVQNRDYADWFVTNAQGRKLIIYCILSQIIGAFLMRAVVRRAT